MNKTHRILSVLLASIVFLSGVDLTPLFSNAAVNYEPATFYVIDVAVQYDSSNSGMKSDISVSYTLPSNYEPLRGARNIKIKDKAELYNFASPQHGMEMKDNEYILKSTDWSTSLFEELYAPFISSRLSFTQQIQLSGTTFSYKYSASKAYAPYQLMDANRLEVYSILRRPNGVQTLKNTLFNHDGQIRLLGDETAYARDYRENYDTIKDAIDNYNKPAYADKKLYITFQPTIFSFTCEVPREYSNGTLKAALNAPSSVKVNKAFTVADATTLSDDLRYERGVLERKIGSGFFETIATWNGPASRGVNSGESKEENISEGGTVTYLLTVTADSGQTDTCEKTVRVETTGDATLDLDWSLPSSVYEGHPALAEDRSEFTEEDLETGRTNYYTIYEAGSHSFRVNPNRNYTQTRIDRADTEFRFSVPGTYDVTINESFRSLHDSDTKSIDVLRTPAISHNLGGYQKQNRKEIITADIAINPNYPLDTWWVRIKDKATGEETILEEGHLSGETANIKTRAATFTTDVNGCYSHIRIEFLTKNPSYNAALGKGNGTNADGTEPYTYEIYARDIRGNTDRVSRDFSVAPDIPPIAAIETEDSFIRERGTNYASLSVKDMSSTDGDSLERSWSYAAADSKTEVFGAYTEITSGSIGYADSSFGSGQNIAFAKEGVGRVNVKLVVKDKIPANETLAEFLAPSDYLASEAVAGTTVVNIAPTVSLEPVEAVNAKVYVYGNLGTDGGAVAGVMESLKALKNNLLPEGIMLDAEDISEGNVVGTPSGYQSNSSADGAKRIFQKIDSYMPYTYDSGAEGRTFWEDGYYSADGECLYVLNPNFYITQAETRDLYAKYGYTFPFTVVAYNLRNSSVKWQTTVTQSMWGSSSIDLGGPVPYNDSEYFLLRTGDSTLVFQKSNGAYLTTFPFVMGEYAWGKNGNLYTLKSDGLYKIDRNGAVSTVFGGYLLSNPKVLNEKLWILSGANGNLKLIKFDFESETSEVSRFVYQYSFSQSSLECLGIDSDGKVAVSDKGTVYVYEDVAALPIFISDSFSAEYVKTFAVNNANDTFRYVGVGGYTDGSGGVNRFATVYDIYSGKKLSYNCTSSYNNNDYGAESVFPPDFKRLLAAWDYGNGIVELATGYPNTLLVYKAPSFGIKRPLPASLSFDFVNTPADNVTSSVGDFAGSPFVGLPNIVTSGRLMDGYYIGAVNSSSHTPEDGDRGIFVVTLPKTSGELENAAVSKNVAEKEPSKTDKAYVLSAAELAESVKKKAESLGYSLLTGLGNAAERIKTLLRRQETATNSILITAGSGTQSTLSRQIKLKPGKDYYYEYSVAETGDTAESADTLSVTENIRKFKAENGLSYLNENSGYVVTGAETEDYSGELNPFFTYQGGEREDDKWKVYASGKDKHGGTWGAAGTFNFTVPEGKKAVLVVDYLVKGSDMRNYHDFPYLSASFDSEVLPGAAERNTVTVPQLIESGMHTFQVYSYVTGSSSYYCGSVCFTKINLYFVEKGANISAGSFGGQGSVSSSNGVKTVSGNFKTDFSVLNYASQNGAAVTATSGATGFGEGITKYFDVTYNGEGRWTEGRKDDRVTYYSNSWTLSLKPEYEVTNVVGLEGTINFSGTYTELRCTKTSDRSWYISWVSIMKNRIQGYPTFSFFMTAIKPGQVNAKLTEGKYFDEGNGFLQVEDRTFDGTTTLTLSSSASSWYLTKFSLYYKENGKKVYVINEEQIGESDLSDWAVSGGIKSFASYNTEKTADENAPLVYRKGENVLQKVSYSDYESDPSKTGSWIYAHEPYNDGLNAKAGIELDELGRVVRIAGEAVEPTAYTIDAAARRIAAAGGQYLLTSQINKFYEDGKYIALYFALDDTSRGISPGGNPNYDKASNIAEIPFYIMGEAASAPWIESISTNPATPKDEDSTRIFIKVDDNEKDTLSLTTEVYRDRELIMTDRKRNITASGGVYPVQTTSAFTAEEGSYEVVCTVRDNTGVGVGVYRFKVGIGAKIEGMVTHTEKWESNRNSYNNAKFSNTIATPTEYAPYAAKTNPRLRNSNVFWSGEKFMLKAKVTGRVNTVRADLYEFNGSTWTKSRYSTTLTSTGQKEGSATIYTGSLYNRDFLYRWSKNEPVRLKIVFVATYSGGKEKVNEEEIIIDNSIPWSATHLIK